MIPNEPDMKKRILILCTGNSCRSQMAEGYLKKINPSLEVYSAGTHPAEQVNPYAIKVMAEAGLDLSGHRPARVDDFLDQAFDYVITVCDGARETCPVFTGKVGQRLHMGVEDPAVARGSEDEILCAFRRIRDEIRLRFGNFNDSIK